MSNHRHHEHQGQASRWHTECLDKEGFLGEGEFALHIAQSERVALLVDPVSSNEPSVDYGQLGETHRQAGSQSTTQQKQLVRTSALNVSHSASVRKLAIVDSFDL
jgi:hypothetical protein